MTCYLHKSGHRKPPDKSIACCTKYCTNSRSLLLFTVRNPTWNVLQGWFRQLFPMTDHFLFLARHLQPEPKEGSSVTALLAFQCPAGRKQWDKLTVTKTWGFACDSVAVRYPSPDVTAASLLPTLWLLFCGQAGLSSETAEKNKTRLKDPSPSLLMTLNWEVRCTCGKWQHNKWQQSCRDTWKGWKSGLARTVWSLFNKMRGKVLHLGTH